MAISALLASQACPLLTAGRASVPAALPRSGVYSGVGATVAPGYLIRGRVATAATGGSVIDRPTIAVPGIDKSNETQKKKPRIYRVMLHNDTFNKREYVVQVLLKVVKSITVDDAVNVMQEAHQNGLACVIACAQEEAELYCEGLRNNGLISSVEPDGSGSGNGDSS
ncbi:hypothetical protein WJX73_003572 [Symbiochloris irregularis]|uniref:Adaptor protein ClpS core domain-containing protein n=1 Tax=Symbiochloris irregularis TaxID=706552 RepID=A0AAW1P5Z6_9CHLO